MVTVTPTILGFLLAVGLYLYARHLDKRRFAQMSQGSRGEYEARQIRQKQHQLLNAMFLSVLGGILLSVLLWLGPGGVEAVRVFLAPRIVVVH